MGTSPEELTKLQHFLGGWGISKLEDCYVKILAKQHSSQEQLDSTHAASNVDIPTTVEIAHNVQN